MAVNIRSLVCVVLLIVGMSVGVARAETYNISTEGKNADEVRLALEHQLVVIKREGDKVKFVTKGLYGLSTRSNPPWRINFSLPIGGMFEIKPRPQQWGSFWLRAVNDKIVTIEYDVGYSHQSLGNDVVVKDKGFVELKLKK